MTTKAADDPDLQVGVVGAGAMGQGIAQVAATGGTHVRLYDADRNNADTARATICNRIDRLVEKGRIEPADAEHMCERLQVVDTLDEFAHCDVVIEAIFEDLEIKQKLFMDLEEVVANHCVLASNTSSLLIASIARPCRVRNRIGGMHFFNPVPLMRLVEIVRGPDTDDATISFMRKLGERMGRTPVTVKDAPGFLVNLGGRAYTTEGMRLLHERVATPAQIDAVMRDCGGFRMGPCELMDLTGVDVNFPVSQIINECYMSDARLKTSFPHRSLFEAGRFGRKTGHGNYLYDETGEMAAGASPDHVSDADPATKVVLVEAEDDLLDFSRSLDCAVLDDDDGTSPLLASPLGEDCSSFAARTGADHARLVAIDLHCNTQVRVTIMTAPGAEHEIRDAVAALIAEGGRKVTAIADSTGFIAQRMQAMVANLGCEMAQIGIASPEEIDLAMQLGLNYPRGPLDLAEHLGLETTLAILERMHWITGDDRYRPSLWLKRRALLGLSCHTAK
jgi:3-hydroxybutyryl-CoA dehydrogenase